MVKNSKDIAKYIKQPYPISEVRGNFTVAQTHILIEMMDQLQGRMEQRMNEGQLSLFKDEDFDDNGRIHIDVKFSDIASRPDYYKEVETLANKMMQMYVKNETEDNGDSFVELEHFVSAVKYSKQGNRRNYIRFSFDKVQAMQLFNMARYSRYLKAVAKGAKNRYTARLYMLMTSTRQFGVYNIKYAELRKILGCDEYDEKEKKFVVKKYPLYKSFKMAVLKTAEKELKDLADEGLSDCWFEVIEHLPKGKSSGAPERLEFIIHTTEMGEIEDLRVNSNKNIMEIERLLKEEYEFSSSDLLKVMKSINEKNADKVLNVLHGVGERLNCEESKINNKKAYVTASINRVFEATSNDAIETVRAYEVSEDAKVKWGVVMLNVREDMREGIKLVEWGRDKVTVSMQPAFIEMYNSVVGEDIIEVLSKATGKPIANKP